MSFTPAFREVVRHGLCAGVRLPGRSVARQHPVPASVLERLEAEERAFAETLGPVRQVTWVGGRLAARAALNELGLASGPILSDDRGAPLFPRGVRGSISHKDDLAVALVTPEDEWTLGVDVELVAGPTYDIAPRVLTDLEREQLAALPEERRAAEVLFAFSAKEALYKALDPHVRRFVAFDEVSVVHDADGTRRFELHLAPDEGPFDTELSWWRWEEMLLVTARVRPKRRQNG